MNKNMTLTIFAICAIMFFVGCKNGIKSIDGEESIEDGEYVEEPLLSRRSNISR